MSKRSSATTARDAPSRVARDDIELVLQLSERIANALHRAHEAGLVHRDIKPANVMVARTGEPVVLDFGLARHEEAPDLTQSGDLLGTPAYMAPEQIRGSLRQIDRRSDVYALGVTLYECLTLRRPFKSATREGLFRAILNDVAVSPRRLNPKISADLEVVIVTAMEKESARRYQTAADLAEDLRRLRLRQPILARPVPARVRVARWAQRNPGVASLLVALFCVLIIGLTQALWSRALILDREEETRSALKKFEQLADVERYDELLLRAESLWPRRPRLVADMKTWLAESDTLFDRRGLHEDAAGELEEKGARSELSREDGWRLSVLRQLLASMQRLSATREQVLQRLDFAESIRALSLEGDAADLWEECIEDVADSDVYDGLELRPLVGLRPIWRNPRTELWEFWHVGSGAEPRVDEDAERLIVDETSGLVFVLIPPGDALIGAQKERRGARHFDPAAEPDEVPLQELEMEAFFLSKFEMTQAQWSRIAGSNPSLHPPGTSYAGTTVSALHPVEQVSWADATTLFSKLDLRMPRESEWEYAARAGSDSPWWTGFEKQTLIGAANLADQAATRAQARFPEAADWPELDDGWPVHAPVNAYRANPFGLHGLCGNVWEWCFDLYRPYQEPLETREVAREDDDRRMRIFRGGSFGLSARAARSANRGYLQPDVRNMQVGCRPARSIR